MAQALRYPTTANFIQKTLGAQLLAGATAAATLNNVTSIQNKPGVMIIDRVDANNVETPTKREVIQYTATSGSTVTTLTRNADASGTDQDHAVGAIVEFGPDILWAQSVIDGLTQVIAPATGLLDTTKVVDLTTAQTLTNKILTAPSITTPTMTSPSVTSGDLNLATGSNVQVNSADPKRGIYIPASGFFPATTTGCAALAQAESTTNKINYKYLAFDGATEEYAWIDIPTPDWWDLSTVTIKFHWVAPSGTGDVIWGAAGLARSDDDAIDTALGTAVTVTDTVTTALDHQTTSATGAITIGGTPAKGDKLYLRVYRDADAAGDTLNGVDAYLTGITLKYGIGQYDDQ